MLHLVQTFSQSLRWMVFLALNEPKVFSNSCYSNSYSFQELQDAFNELFWELETMNFKFKKMISKLEFENDFLLK
ncbi:hypothetical protein GQ457_04G021750 [Hibiscus cannabinus]